MQTGGEEASVGPDPSMPHAELLIHTRFTLLLQVGIINLPLVSPAPPHTHT